MCLHVWHKQHHGPHVREAGSREVGSRRSALWHLRTSRINKHFLMSCTAFIAAWAEAPSIFHSGQMAATAMASALSSCAWGYNSHHAASQPHGPAAIAPDVTESSTACCCTAAPGIDRRSILHAAGRCRSRRRRPCMEDGMAANHYLRRFLRLPDRLVDPLLSAQGSAQLAKWQEWTAPQQRWRR